MRIANLLLALTAIVLIALIMFLSRQPDQVKQTRLIETPASDITNVRIVRQGEPELIFRKQQGQWVLLRGEHVTLLANDWKLDQILALSNIKEFHRVESNGNLNEFGLDDALIKVELNKTEILFGETNPVNRQRYISVDSQVFLIKDDVYRHVIDDWYEFVAKTLIGKRQNLAGIVINEFKLAKSPSGRWSMDTARKEVSMDEVQTFIDSWRFAEAISVQEYQSRPFDLKVELKFENGVIRRLEGVVENKELVLADRQHMIEYRFSTTASEQLLPHF